jgi:hypothetical protein
MPIRMLVVPVALRVALRAPAATVRTCLVRESDPVARHGQVIVAWLTQAAGAAVLVLVVPLLVVVTPPGAVLVEVVVDDVVVVDEVVELEVVLPVEVVPPVVVVVVPVSKAHDHGYGWQALASWASG